ncbi:MAG TPA: chemotaxis protein CheA, partial [bacterium]|nr:chemotaxis protein CheA [bacterium]
MAEIKRAGSPLEGMDEKKLLRTFLEEVEELLEKLDLSLLELEKDRSNPELVNEIFRLTHSIKSESALLGYSSLTNIAHSLEDVFEKVRSGTLELKRPLMDKIFSGSDLIHEIVSRISKGDVDIDSLFADLEFDPETDPDVTEGSREESEEPGGFKDFERFQLQEARDRGEQLYRLEFDVDPDASMKYPRAYLVFRNLEKIVSVVKTDPDMVKPAEDSRYLRVTLFITGTVEERILRKTCALDLISGVTIEALKYDSVIGSDNHRPGAGDAPGPLAAIKKSRIEKSSVRVETRKLNDLWQMVGDLIISKAQVLLLCDRLQSEWHTEKLGAELAQVADSLDRIGNGMQQALVETRMVSISVLFNKFPRLVRDLSRKLSKKVDLQLTGNETEIDRSIIEILSDPLTHIIRNALDHGIETSGERLKAGKSENGLIKISARQRGGSIVIEVSDDGRGLDIEKIRQKAAERDLSDAELIKLIFVPGFSTKDSVTDLSGRGVGMDVVATRIKEDLKGDVVLKTEKGGGTVITIFLPLTLTILHSLVIRCGNHTYAIPVRDVDETMKVASSNILHTRRGSFINYDTEEIPFLNLLTLFSSGSGRADGLGPNGEHSAVVINHEGTRVC